MALTFAVIGVILAVAVNVFLVASLLKERPEIMPRDIYAMFWVLAVLVTAGNIWNLISLLR